jgi:hypothetical protein
LKWPGFVEFDDVNGKVLTYSAQDRYSSSNFFEGEKINLIRIVTFLSHSNQYLQGV